MSSAYQDSNKKFLVFISSQIPKKLIKNNIESVKIVWRFQDQILRSFHEEPRG